MSCFGWEKPLKRASPGRNITGPEAVAQVAAMIGAGHVAPPVPVPDGKAKSAVKAKAAAAPAKATPKVPSKAAGVPAQIFYEARFVRGQWFLCQINPNTGEETVQPLDPSDYFPEPAGSATPLAGVPGPTEETVVTYDDTRANLFESGTKHANRHTAGAMQPVTAAASLGLPSLFPRAGLDDDEDDESEEAAIVAADPAEVGML